MSFDPNDFMTQTVDAPMETEFKLCPEGEFRAMIDDFDATAIENIEFEYKRGPNAGLPGEMRKFNCPFVIDDDKARQELNRDKVIVTKQMILDVVKDTGALDFGTNKNVELGRVRAAVNQNAPGPWSIGQLRGAGPCMVQVKHVSYKRNDGTQGKRAEITRVARIS